MLPLIIAAGIAILLLLPRGDRIQGVDSHGVISYQNKGKSNPTYYNGVYTGLKYECVEYARRWLVQVKGYTFGEVENAYQIYDLPTVESLEGVTVRFESIPSTSYNIQVGDLVIYRQSNEFPHGHVAVVSKVDASFVYLSEQNLNKKKWKGDYSQQLSKTKLNDGNIIGWKRIRI
jgi:glutathionylspermidine amidase/synthetase